MSNQEQPRPEHPSTYVVADRSSQDELRRLHLQDHLLTQRMGGVLPEQPTAEGIERVLDIGCGTGGWLIETARAYPSIKLLVGIDVSRTFVEYARAQAETAQVSDRVEFQAMDALRMLEFPSGFFDLVNQRLGSSFLRTWEWDKLLREAQRVARTGGVLRITESDMVTESSSPAFLRFNQVVFQALEAAGHFFARQADGVTSHLPHFLEQYGLQHVQVHAHHMEYRTGTQEWQLFYEDAERAARTLLPFVQRWSRAPADYQELCQQMLVEMRQPDFTATWQALTVWGRVSPSS